MRKHFYLVTDHDDADRIGAILTTDSRRARPNKNEEAPSHRIDKDAGEIEQVGELVGMGYHDFDDEADLEARIEEVIKTKLGEIDDDWLEKAGVAEVVA